jgi:hypothetical protein
MTTKQKPQTAEARPWDEIEGHYIELNRQGWGHDRLLELVRHIKATGLVDRLYAYTSMDKLVVSIYDPVEWNREALHIEFDRHSQRWDFKYISRPNEKPEFERQYSAELGLEKFDKFVLMIKW